MSVPGVNVEVLVGVWLKKTSVNLKVVVHNCPGLELGRSVVVQMIRGQTLDPNRFRCWVGRRHLAGGPHLSWKESCP